MSHRVRLIRAPLPPIYAIECADSGIYIAGFLTAENRAAYVAQNGWEVVL